MFFLPIQGCPFGFRMLVHFESWLQKVNLLFLGPLSAVIPFNVVEKGEGLRRIQLCPPSTPPIIDSNGTFFQRGWGTGGGSYDEIWLLGMAVHLSSNATTKLSV